MTEPLLFSPLLKYFDEQDSKYRLLDTNLQEMEAEKNCNPKTLIAWILTDWQFRADNQGVVVVSTKGETGSGKSLGTLGLAIMNAQIFGVPLNLQDILYDPFVVNKEVREKANRSTSLVDENVKHQGMMSRTIYDLIGEFEEKGRYTQKCIFWVSPEDVGHRHTFLFEADPLRMERKSNPICNRCPLYRECKKSFNKTLCEDKKVQAELKIKKPVMPFDRTGYPIAFHFRVYTKNKFTKMPQYRGWINVPMVEFDTAQKYDEIKRKNIKKMEAMENENVGLLEGIGNRIYEKMPERIFKVNAKGRVALEGASFIKRIIYQEAPHLTNQASEYVYNAIREKAREKVGTVPKDKNK